MYNCLSCGQGGSNPPSNVVKEGARMTSFRYRIGEKLDKLKEDTVISGSIEPVSEEAKPQAIETGAIEPETIEEPTAVVPETGTSTSDESESQTVDTE